MKKMMIAAICMMMISMSCMANGKGYNNHDNKGNEPKVEMRHHCAKHDKKQIDKASEKYEKELKKILGYDNYKRYEFLTNDHLAMNNDHHGNDKGHDGSNRGGNNTTIVAHGRR